MQTAEAERLQWLKFVFGLMVICGALHAFGITAGEYRFWLRVMGVVLTLVFFANVLWLMQAGSRGTELPR